MENQESMLLIYEMIPEEVTYYLFPKKGNTEVEELLTKANGFVINISCEEDNPEGSEAAAELNYLLEPDSEDSLHKYLVEDMTSLSSGVNIKSVFKCGFAL